MRETTAHLYFIENNMVEREMFLICFRSDAPEEMREDGHRRQEELALDKSMERFFLV